MHKCVHEGTRCVRYLILTGILAPMSTIQNHQSTIFGHNLSFQKTTPPFCADTVQQGGILGASGGCGWKYNQGL